MQKITGPKEFFQELNFLFRQLGHEKEKGNLSPSTLDALARVLSWVPQMETVDFPRYARPWRGPSEAV